MKCFKIYISVRLNLLCIYPLLIAATLLCAPCEAGLAQTSKSIPRPKIGLVLAGGGALGLAHVGVLKVLEANRVPVDIITGTSMGSIVGAGYASGATVAEMEQVLSETDWDALFKESLEREDIEYRNKYGRGGQLLGDAKIGLSDNGFARFTGVVSGQHVLPLLQNLYHRTPGKIDFDKLPVPFRAIAADIESGQAIPLRSGDLALAARASMAVPGFFTPVEIDGKALVDGGIANNLPVDIALEMGAKRLIVVDLVADLKKKDELGNVLGISGQIISLLLQQNSTLQRKNIRPGDLLLVPDLKGFSATDFNRGKEILARGEAIALQHLPELRKFSVTASEYRAYRTHREQSVPLPPVITSVKVTTDLPALSDLIEKDFAFQIGSPLNTNEISQIIDQVYTSGALASLTYQVEKSAAGENILAITAEKPKWHDKYMQVGFSLQDDFEGNSAYQLALGARLNGLNSAGAFLDTRIDIGWRPMLELDYYQPLSQNSEFFINPIFTIDRYSIPARLNGEILAEYERSRIIGGIGAGRKIGKGGELQIGARRGNGDIERRIGDPSLNEGSYQIGNYFGQINFDSRDTPDFPRNGTLFNIEAARHTDTLGSSDNFTQLFGSIGKPFSYGANTVLFSTDYGYSLDEIPATRVYVIGGMFDLSGYQPGGLAASDFVIGRMAYYRELASLGGAFAKLNLFGGGSFELASVRSDLPQIDDNTGIIGGLLFVGADTPILPLYFAAGMNNDNEASLYLNIGRIFRARR